jgi:hypothetical protein
MTWLFGISSSAAQKRDPYSLTHEEVTSRPDLKTAFDAVQQLRPRFLRSSKRVGPGTEANPPVVGQPGGAAENRAAGSAQDAGILVVVDGVQRGGITELKGIPVEEVESIRFLLAEAARIAHYGPNQTGVIEVKTRPRAKSPDRIEILTGASDEEASSLGQSSSGLNLATFASGVSSNV